MATLEDRIKRCRWLSMWVGRCGSVAMGWSLWFGRYGLVAVAMSVGRFVCGVVGPSFVVSGGRSLWVGCFGRSLCPSVAVTRSLCVRSIPDGVTAQGFEGQNQVLCRKVTISPGWLLTYETMRDPEPQEWDRLITSAWSLAPDMTPLSHREVIPSTELMNQPPNAT